MVDDFAQGFGKENVHANMQGGIIRFSDADDIVIRIRK